MSAPSTERPTWACCRECGTADHPVLLDPLIPGWWNCPECRKSFHGEWLELAEKRATLDAEIAECYAEDIRRGDRKGGGARSKRYGQEKPAAPRRDYLQEESGGARPRREADRTKAVRVPEDHAEQVAELAKAAQIPQQRLAALAMQRGLEQLRGAKWCLTCGYPLEECRCGE